MGSATVDDGIDEEIAVHWAVANDEDGIGVCLQDQAPIDHRADVGGIDGERAEETKSAVHLTAVEGDCAKYIVPIGESDEAIGIEREGGR